VVARVFGISDLLWAMVAFSVQRISRPVGLAVKPRFLLVQIRATSRIFLRGQTLTKISLFRTHVLRRESCRLPLSRKSDPGPIFPRIGLDFVSRYQLTLPALGSGAPFVRSSLPDTACATGGDVNPDRSTDGRFRVH
jgi:hypothetical protein